MKRIALLFILIVSIIIIFLFLRKKNPLIEETVFEEPRQGVAVIITGAAARIPQEAALLEELDRRGLLKDLVFISGASSGALNSVVLNGILSHKLSWKDYKKLLSNLKTDNIFVQQGKHLPVNTSPARNLYKKVAEEKLGYHSIGDLPFTTSISITHLEDAFLKKTSFRMCSRKINTETDTTLSLVDIMMASSAFPIVFPSVKIKNATTIPDIEYVDGGVGEDHVPFRALLEFEKHRGKGVEKVFIISRKSDNVPELSEELQGLGINDKGLFDRLGISFDAFLRKGFINQLHAYSEVAPELITRSYVWIPELDTNYLLFNFDNLKEQYDLTSQWAKNHDPLPLSKFLISNN